MASLNRVGAGKALLKNTDLMNGSGKENLKTLTQKEINKVSSNVSFTRVPKKDKPIIK